MDKRKKSLHRKRVSADDSLKIQYNYRDMIDFGRKLAMQQRDDYNNLIIHCAGGVNKIFNFLVSKGFNLNDRKDLFTISCIANILIQSGTAYDPEKDSYLSTQTVYDGILETLKRCVVTQKDEYNNEEVFKVVLESFNTNELKVEIIPEDASEIKTEEE